MRVENAIIMAAGTSSRFAPLSYELPKALVEVRGEVLIERQIAQLREAGIDDIYVITGFKGEMLDHLRESHGVTLIRNEEYLVRNNNSSIWAAREVLGASYLCSADNYFSANPFEAEVDDAYYAAVWADGPTAEWCMEEDEAGDVCSVSIGGANAWYMLGHTFWSPEFSETFLRILEAEYDLPQTAPKLWEAIFAEHLDELKMKVRRYADDVIFEFDTLDELRQFDESYVDDTRSEILRSVCAELGIAQRDVIGMRPREGASTQAAGFEFECPLGTFGYDYGTARLMRV